MSLTQKHVNQLAYEIVGCAIEVHKELGPGLLESVYEKCLIYELDEKGLDAKSQVPIPIHYKKSAIDANYKLDILVEDLIIVELKAVEKMLPVFQAQLITYLTLAKKPKGLLINFNSKNIITNLIPIVTPQFAKLPKA
ncbi:MAG: GxxExxY protein [Candidatus Marinimicrobia bacterium]|nr:GxxExxY protein [Candidatus Neomarinimicrobiota bacterium]